MSHFKVLMNSSVNPAQLKSQGGGYGSGLGGASSSTLYRPFGHNETAYGPGGYPPSGPNSNSQIPSNPSGTYNYSSSNDYSNASRYPGGGVTSGLSPSPFPSAGPPRNPFSTYGSSAGGGTAGSTLNAGLYGSTGYPRTAGLGSNAYDAGMRQPPESASLWSSRYGGGGGGTFSENPYSNYRSTNPLNNPAYRFDGVNSRSDHDRHRQQHHRRRHRDRGRRHRRHSRTHSDDDAADTDEDEEDRMTAATDDTAKTSIFNGYGISEGSDDERGSYTSSSSYLSRSSRRSRGTRASRVSHSVSNYRHGHRQSRRHGNLDPVQLKVIQSIIHSHLPEDLRDCTYNDIIYHLEKYNQEGYISKELSKRGVTLTEKEVRMFEAQLMKDKELGKKKMKYHLRSGARLLRTVCKMLNIKSLRTKYLANTIDEEMESGEYDGILGEMAPKLRGSIWDSPVFALVTKMVDTYSTAADREHMEDELGLNEEDSDNGLDKHERRDEHSSSSKKKSKTSSHSHSHSRSERDIGKESSSSTSSRSLSRLDHMGDHTRSSLRSLPRPGDLEISSPSRTDTAVEKKKT